MKHRMMLVVAGLMCASSLVSLGACSGCNGGAPEGFVRIEAGTFMMGNEGNQHEVTLTRAFFMQAHEVTHGEYQRLMPLSAEESIEAIPRRAPRRRSSGCAAVIATGWLQSETANCPVEDVSWLDAITYANHRSAAEGLPLCYTLDGALLGVETPYDCEGYRLPTEAEWEYAARAGTQTDYYCGDVGTGCLDDIAWHGRNSERTTHPVGQKTPNAWGLYDILGNVSEWTGDWLADYPSSAQRFLHGRARSGPASWTDPSGPGSGSPRYLTRFRVLRGGGWDSGSGNLRSARRGNYGPGARTYDLGFRIVRTAP